MSFDESSCEIFNYYGDNISRYVNISICFVGVILNLFNILVFTRKNMMSSANLIFTHLSVVDLLFLFSTIPFTWIKDFQYSIDDVDHRTYTHAVIYSRCQDLTHVLNYMSAFLTVMLAIWRYIAVAHPLKERSWCDMKTTRNVVIAVYISSVLLNIPYWFTSNITTFYTDDGEPWYYPFPVVRGSMADISYLTTAVLEQLLPSVALPIFSFKLIVVLLRKSNNVQLQTSSSSIRNNTRNLRMKQQTDRSIIITLVVVASFLIVRLPTGISKLIVSIPIPSTYIVMSYNVIMCIHKLRSVFGTLNIINMSITFIVYYTMSQNFRATFKFLFSSINVSSPEVNQVALGSMRKSYTGPRVLR
ncbi:sex peptide receptor-related protein 2-like [Planococcus citri]|uniref:sex peptide receptor-related protein 2-like n=1 Tax=Planococcus citri TaxID=170843 RepID=UPI0031F73D02